MTVQIKIDLSRYKSALVIKRKGFIFDPFRKKEVALQPEEIVRQLLLQYLVLEKNYNKNYIAVEKGLRVNGLERRFDAVVFNSSMEVKLLIECKAPDVPLTDAVFRQVGQYNQVFNADYLLVSNGNETYCCKMDYENYAWSFLTDVPDARTLDNLNKF